MREFYVSSVQCTFGRSSEPIVLHQSTSQDRCRRLRVALPCIYEGVDPVGGGLRPLGLNFHSKSGSISDSTCIALMIIMLFGWFLCVFIRLPKRIRLAQLHAAVEGERDSWKGTAEIAVKTMARWRVFYMLPLLLLGKRLLLMSAESGQRHDFQYPHSLTQWRPLL